MNLIANILAVVVVGFLVLRYGRDRHAGHGKAVRWLRIAGLNPLSFQILVYLIFGIGEMASGEMGGAMHLLEAIVVVLLGVLAWSRPLEGGIALLVCGALSAIDFVVARVTSGPLPGGAVVSASFLILASPMILSSVLFLIAGLLSRRAVTPGTNQGK